MGARAPLAPHASPWIPLSPPSISSSPPYIFFLDPSLIVDPVEVNPRDEIQPFRRFKWKPGVTIMVVMSACLVSLVFLEKTFN